VSCLGFGSRITQRHGTQGWNVSYLRRQSGLQTMHRDRDVETISGIRTGTRHVDKGLEKCKTRKGRRKSP
jgi:hypothetical protein